ncbi:MAG: hypothetical protein ACLQHM_13085 [Limisphaerales bacterium]
MEQADFHDIKVVATGGFTMNLRMAFDFRSSDAGLDAAKRMEWFYRLGYERRRLAKRCCSSNPGFSLKIVGQFSG